jgi:D-hexose-6-phosphate mutarotase
MSDPTARGAPLPPGVRLGAGEGGLPRVDVATPACAAQVYLHGAHVAAWQPAHAAAPVLWMSGRSAFAAGKPIRGGVPVCFPWFGPHPSAAGAPAHGFARLMDWTLAAATVSDEGVTLVFALGVDPQASAAWPWRARVEHRITAGASLAMQLTVSSLDERPFAFEEALHTYLSVGDIERTSVAGLELAEYLDKTAGSVRRRREDAPIRFTGETDRVYLDTEAACTVRDARRRRISIAKSGSASTIVWNPWVAKARAMPDFGDDEWRHMVCVETANVGASAVRLEPGETHVMSARIAVGPDA